MREALINLCRYYKGEKTCPPNVEKYLWDTERMWVEMASNDDENSVDANSLASSLSEYIGRGLNAVEGVPISLCAFHLTRWTKANYFDKTSFMNFLNDIYKK